MSKPTRIEWPDPGDPQPFWVRPWAVGWSHPEPYEVEKAERQPEERAIVVQQGFVNRRTEKGLGEPPPLEGARRFMGWNL